MNQPIEEILQNIDKTENVDLKPTYYQGECGTGRSYFSQVMDNASDITANVEEVDKYCSNCGEDEDFTYIRTTASGYHNKGTNHYKCNNCGEELSFVEDL